MAIDLIASLLVGLLGIVSVVLFVRGIFGVFAASHHEAHYPW